MLNVRQSAGHGPSKIIYTLAVRQRWNRTRHHDGTAVTLSQPTPLPYICCRRDSSAAERAHGVKPGSPPSQFTDLQCQSGTGHRLAIVFALSVSPPSILRYYPVAKDLIDIASQPDSESTSTIASTSTMRPPPHNGL